ncbi:MAG: hypothetical protein GEU93_16845 [Propionibacteriales bacterium]|nr:hypothetical protein [Propionibacteriales bacterium]
MILTTPGAQGLAQAEGQGEVDDAHLDDLDTRSGAPGIRPTAAQLDAAADLGATARWSRFGTAQSLIKHGDSLSTDVQGADPAAAARAWIEDHRVLYRLDSVGDLQLHAEVALDDDAHVVVFRQRVNGLTVAPEGTATVGLVGSPGSGWDIAYASSNLVAGESPTGATDLTMREALVEAADDAGADVETPDVSMGGGSAGWRVLEVENVEPEQLVRRIAFPTLDNGIRRAYETIYFDGADQGYRYVVDAENGDVLYRESIVHEQDEDPTWDVFPATPRLSTLGRPPWNYPSADSRELWCWTATPGCRRVLENDAARVPWDVDAATGEPTFTTTGNAVSAAEWWNTVAPAEPGQRPSSAEREYRFPWTNSWFRSGCNSENLVPGGNNIDASVTNLFAGNWRMHDWAYHLGFTEETWNGQDINFGINPEGEGDAVTARAQAGAITPGSRNNATMATRPDGTSSIMSMFLWQPQANGFYGPCAVGDFDMSVIGHEYTHMIENRMIGKGSNRMGFHAGAMGESWADFVSMEHQNEYGVLPVAGENRWAVGAYVTGNPIRGIRNYNMSFPSAGQFPQAGRDIRVGALNFGSMGYDIVGPQVHADSQIWSATNFDIRSLLLDRYPSRGSQQQRRCADGLVPVEQCPGNRQWIQLVFDAMLLMPTNPTMLDARDAYFAADLMRFGGANQDLLWLGFARRGFGENASVTGTQDTDPVPSYESPLHDEATLRFEAVAKDEGGGPVDAEVFVGDYDARTTPIEAVERFVPDPRGYNFVSRADGYGHVRFYVRNLSAGEDRTIRMHFPTNVASLSQGAEATGDGFRQDELIDDAEATNWLSWLPNAVTVDPPSAAAGRYPAAGAAFGPEPTLEGFAGDIVLANDGSENPTEGCDPLIGFPAGAIALIDRGSCAFVQKVNNAQDAGAGAVIVANNAPGDPSTMGGTDPEIVIPSVMVSLQAGTTIKAGLPATGTVASEPSRPAEGSQVTIALDGEQSFRLAKASALLLQGQNRFTALRQFELYACTEGNADNPTCDGATDAGWERFLRSQPDAFPAPNPRPSSPDLLLRTFQIRDTAATHVKFVVAANQCTGNPNFQGNQHDDPASPTSDCRSTTVGTNEVRAAELQLLTSRPQVDGAALTD